MNKTKKITQGAMMLAIFGALILIDRLTAYWFTEFVVLIAPIIIIMYSAMQTFKDGLLLSVGVLIIAFLLGNFQLTYVIYVPVGVVTGIAYSYGIKNNFDKGRLLFISCFTYIVGELLASYVIYPLLGFPVSQMIEEFKTTLPQAGNMLGIDYSAAFATMGLQLDNVLIILICITIVLMGAMEGFLIHLLSIFLLKRFKIVDLGRINIYDRKPNKVLAYVCFACVCLGFLVSYVDNQMIKDVMVVICVLGFIILLYYGYLFIAIYGAINRKNYGFIVTILCFFIPPLFLCLMIVGFLYGSGPLTNYIDNKINGMKNE